MEPILFCGMFFVIFSELITMLYENLISFLNNHHDVNKRV